MNQPASLAPPPRQLFSTFSPFFLTGRDRGALEFALRQSADARAAEIAQNVLIVQNRLAIVAKLFQAETVFTFFFLYKYSYFHY